MNKYHGKLIHKVEDEHGAIEVVDDGQYRSLHFGTEPKQSSMQLADPVALTLSYTRAMTSALLFHDDPQRFLLLGLGGGSLARYLLHHYPHAHIDAVEFRPLVRDIAYSHFCLPEDPRLVVHIDDAGHFLRQADEDHFGEYDAIFIDAFVGTGIARSVCGISVYDACRSRLSQQGMLSMNLWSGDFIRASDIIEDLRDCFTGNVMQLPVLGKENIIALASSGYRLKKQLRKIAARSTDLEQITGVEYGVFVRQLRKHNSWLSFL